MTQSLGVRGRFWDGREFRSGWLHWREGRVAESGFGEPPGEFRGQLQDLGDCRLVPGLVDTLVHGFAGVDAGEEPDLEALQHFSFELARSGVTTALAGFYPTPLTRLRRVVPVWNRFRETVDRGFRGCRIPGWHMEGPFIHPEMRGALPFQAITPPSRQAAEALVQACGGWLRLSTFAPELEGMEEAAAVLFQHQVVPSIGHSKAGFDHCRRLAAGGPVAQTHLGNRILPLAAREPGPQGFAMAGGTQWVGVIPDGVHVRTETLKLWSDHPVLGPRLMYQSDALSHAGLPAQKFLAGGQWLHRDGAVARDADGGLGGGLDSLWTSLSWRLSEGSLSWSQVLQGACFTPGNLVGDCGTLEVGMPADFLAVEDDLSLAGVWLGGRPVPRAGGPARA
ncbi:MAG: N-acetylglucosamine-6-phosphate deacetylase [Planctomycetota bacterium]|nr:MAG: N-acetylglucosamine-6-phosphate deacetylase [Planctomycetota bacterium]